MSQLADVNIQSSVGMFTFYGVSCFDISFVETYFI